MDLGLLLAVFNEEQHFGHVVPLLATHSVTRARTRVRDGARPLLCCWTRKGVTRAGRGAERAWGRSSPEPARRATGSSYCGYRKGRGDRRSYTQCGSGFFLSGS